MKPVVAALALLIVCCSRPTFALDPKHTLTQYSHRVWGLEEGLEQPTIYSILQTESGYLWLGTQDGLIRFDGVRFRQMDEVFGNPFRHSLVRALAEDQSHNLWVGTMGNGLLRLTPDGAISHFGKSEGLPSDDIACLARDRNGSLWICTEEGLVHRENAKWHVFTTADGLANNEPRDICEAGDGSHWIAFRDAGVMHLTSRGFERSGVRGNPELQRTQALNCARDGSVWVGTENGLLHISGGSAQRFGIRDGLPNDWISTLTQSSDGSLWIGTRNGFSRLQTDSGRYSFSNFTPKDGLSHSTALALYFDHEGSLWVGTKNGLDQFADSNLTPYTVHEGMPGNDAGPVIEDAAGRLWVGTLGRGLGEFEGGRFRTLNTNDGLGSDRILSLENGADGDLWVGTDSGISRLRNGRLQRSYARSDGLSGSAVRALFLDSLGTLWAGTDGGLDRFTGNRFVEVSAPGVPHISGVVALAGGTRTRLFVSAQPSEFYLLRDQSLTRSASMFTTPGGATRAVTSYCFLDRAKHIVWMGTLGSGLLRWQNGNLTHVYIRDGLYDNRIYSILEDGAENLWLASSKGIFRVNAQELEEFAAGRLRRITSIPFTTGQLRFECQPGVQPAAWRAHDGRLWFSTTTGLVVIDPEHLMTTRMAPPVRISSIYANGQRTPLATDSPLRPDQKNLEIRYTALTFVSPEKVTFRYVLEGYDKTWTDAGPRRAAFYTNLPPGRFRFRVAARNADGIGSAEDASINFIILPRLYQRSWFWPLMIGVLVSLGTAAYRLRVRRLRNRFNLIVAERGRIARELHDTLLQGLAGVTMQLQALWTTLPGSPEKDVLGEIITDAGRCSSDARRSLFGLRVNDAHPGGFSNDLIRSARQATAGSSASLILEVEPVTLDSSPELGFELLRIAQEAISNSLRHAAAETVRLALRQSGNDLQLTVEDDGKGFDPEASFLNHYGLAGMRERAVEMGAELEIHSTRGLGTRVTVRVPLRSRNPAFQYLGARIRNIRTTSNR